MRDKILENNVKTIRGLDKAKVFHDIIMLKPSVSMSSSDMRKLKTHVEVFK
jgi:hypothetical protein